MYLLQCVELLLTYREDLLRELFTKNAKPVAGCLRCCGLLKRICCQQRTNSLQAGRGCIIPLGEGIYLRLIRCSAQILEKGVDFSSIMQRPGLFERVN